MSLQRKKVVKKKTKTHCETKEKCIANQSEVSVTDDSSLDQSTHDIHLTRKTNAKRNRSLDKKIKSGSAQSKSKGHILFRNVSVEFTTFPKILNKVSFEILPGQKVGMVGKVNSDLNSIPIALYRLPTEGIIMIDNEDLSSVDVVKDIFILHQDPVLHSKTVRGNLDIFKDFSDSEIWEALESVKLKEQLEQCNIDLDTEFDFKALSSTLKQQLFLAQAVIKKPKILVVKEGEELDNADEISKLHKIILNSFSNTTVIFLASHPETIQDCDKIFYLDDGEIVEEGEPSELLKNTSSRLSDLVLNLNDKIQKGASKIEIISKTFDENMTNAFFNRLDNIKSEEIDVNLKASIEDMITRLSECSGEDENCKTVNKITDLDNNFSSLIDKIGNSANYEGCINSTKCEEIIESDVVTKDQLNTVDKDVKNPTLIDREVKKKKSTSRKKKIKRDEISKGNFEKESVKDGKKGANVSAEKDKSKVNSSDDEISKTSQINQNNSIPTLKSNKVSVTKNVIHDNSAIINEKQKVKKNKGNNAEENYIKNVQDWLESLDDNAIKSNEVTRQESALSSLSRYVLENSKQNTRNTEYFIKYHKKRVHQLNTEGKKYADTVETSSVNDDNTKDLPGDNIMPKIEPIEKRTNHLNKKVYSNDNNRTSFKNEIGQSRDNTVKNVNKNKNDLEFHKNMYAKENLDFNSKVNEKKFNRIKAYESGEEDIKINNSDEKKFSKNKNPIITKERGTKSKKRYPSAEKNEISENSECKDADNIEDNISSQNIKRTKIKKRDNSLLNNNKVTLAAKNEDSVKNATEKKEGISEDSDSADVAQFKKKSERAISGGVIAGRKLTEEKTIKQRDQPTRRKMKTKHRNNLKS